MTPTPASCRPAPTLDHETRPSYTVTVTVSDGKDAEGNADTTADDTITVTIDVTDAKTIRRSSPAQTDTRTVAENTAAGTAHRRSR